MSNNYGSIQPSSSSSAMNSNRQFSPTEFLILKESITTNIVKIKKEYHKLTKLEKMIGGKNDTHELRSKIQQMKKLNNEIFTTTSSDIKKLSSIVKFASNDGSKTNRLMLEKLVDEFHVVGEKYLAAEKVLDMKMRKSLLVNIAADAEESDDENVNMSLQQQKLMNADLKTEVQVMKNREDDVKTIEKNVIDINQMMKEISTMIEEQGENVGTIADTVSNVAEDVEGGISELEKASNYQQKFRRKLVIILIIAIVVALIVVFSLYSKLKN